MSKKPISTIEALRAQYLNCMGLEQYARWELENAVSLFQEAIRLNTAEPEYYLNLARAQVRLGNYELMQQAIRDYIQIEPNKEFTGRFENLLRNTMDEVEVRLTTLMPQPDIQLELVRAAMQMWLEYRVTLGQEPLDLNQPEVWAAALDYTARKVNLAEVSVQEVAQRYGTTETAVRIYHTDLVRILDLISCDYRYFRGQNNPLDQLAEAASLVAEAEQRFREAKQIMQRALSPQKQRRRLASTELTIPYRC
jgi:hypothetical protein